MMKNVRMLLLLAIIAVSMILIALPFLAKKSGVEVVGLDANNKCNNINVGDIITQVNDKYLDNTIDFNNIVKSLAANSYATMIVNNGPGGCNVDENGNIGVNVKDVVSGGLKFGLEIGGGITNTYMSVNYNKSVVEEIVSIIKKRVELMGLQDVKAYSSEGVDKKTMLKISGINDENFGTLTINGRFTAKISQNIELKNSTGKFVIEDQTHSVSYSDYVNVDGLKRNVGEEFLLDDTKFYVSNFTDKSVTLDALTFSNEDILSVFTVASYAKYQSDMQQYEIYIPVKTSDAAANRFANLTKRMNTKIIGNNVLLDGSLIYSLDDKIMTPLPISFESAGKVRNVIAIIGFEKTAKSANSEKIKIETILQSGSLSTTLKLVGSERYVGSLEYEMKNYLPIAAGAILLLVMVAGRLMSKSWKNSLFSIALSIGEIIFVFGLITLVQRLGYSWIIDIEVMVGFFAIVFIGFLDSYIKMSKKKRTIFRLCIFLISFISLFTVWKDFGMVLITALILKTFLTDNIRSNLKVNVATKT